MSSTETFDRCGYAGRGSADARGRERRSRSRPRAFSKSFRVPDASHRLLQGARGASLYPPRLPRSFRRCSDVSFEVRRGEFFGIVGRNGSGKSTLLKLLASIYRADAGTIRMAGRVAPFIELGVGFNVDLTARENVELNGVMMGMTRGEARRRLDEVLDFAELEEFVDLKLKNYSSGMLVRLAFSLMIQSETDILLIDEVLAVGDAAFQQKCADVFTEMSDGDRTVVLVTHDMALGRPLLPSRDAAGAGRAAVHGRPRGGRARVPADQLPRPPDRVGGHRRGGARPARPRHRGPPRGRGGKRIQNIAEGEPIRINIVLEALRGHERPALQPDGPRRRRKPRLRQST